MSSSTGEGIEVDPVSLLVGVPASKALSALESTLAARGFTLGMALDRAAPTRADAASVTVGEWLAEGAPGAASVFADPADHLVAGLLATLPNGTTLEVRPTPRRAVGPDLTALLLGTEGRFGTIRHAWLRIHRCDARRPAMPLPQGVDLDPPVNDGEARLLDTIARELSR